MVVLRAGLRPLLLPLPLELTARTRRALPCGRGKAARREFCATRLEDDVGRVVNRILLEPQLRPQYQVRAIAEQVRLRCVHRPGLGAYFLEMQRLSHLSEYYNADLAGLASRLAKHVQCFVTACHTWQIFSATPAR